MSDADNTPVDGKTTIEMVLDKLSEMGLGLEAVGADTKLAVAEAREAKGHALNTYDLQLELNEHVKRVERRLVVVEVTRAWPAVVALVALGVAVLALLRAW